MQKEDAMRMAERMRSEAPEGVIYEVLESDRSGEQLAMDEARPDLGGWYVRRRPTREPVEDDGR